LRALVIQYDAGAPGGLVSEWLDERGAEQELCRIDGERPDVDPRDYDLIVPLGSEAAAYDDAVPWLADQLTMLHRAGEADIPVLGICFGSQLLARALGGRALPAERSEIGWMAVESRDPSLVPAGPWLQWHHDTFTVPAGAALLADSPAGPQAYTIGRSLGVQFHPEVTPEIVEAWVAADGEALDRHGIDRDRLLAQTRALAGENRLRARRLLDVFIARVARIW
jgi:GMP synthase-like glutamine amidotransferase